MNIFSRFFKNISPYYKAGERIRLELEKEYKLNRRPDLIGRKFKLYTDNFKHLYYVTDATNLIITLNLNNNLSFFNNIQFLTVFFLEGITSDKFIEIKN